MENNEVTNLIWDTKIPAKFKLNFVNLACETEPPTYYIMLNRIHYISIYYSEIHDHFKNFISPTFTIDDLWLEWKEKPILWDVPFGVLYDLNQTDEGNLPIEILVQYRFYPKDYLRNRLKHSLKEFYLWDLKQASCIKFEKDASNIIYDLPSEDIEKMWENYQKVEKKNFEAIFNQIWDIKRNENKRMDYKCLPIRIYLNDPKIKIQRGVKIEKNKENKTIGDFLNEIFPDFFDKSMKLPNQYKFICHGIELNLNIPLMFLYEKFYYFDGFIYITLRIS